MSAKSPSIQSPEGIPQGVTCCFAERWALIKQLDHQIEQRMAVRAEISREIDRVLGLILNSEVHE